MIGKGMFISVERMNEVTPSCLFFKADLTFCFMLLSLYSCTGNEGTYAGKFTNKGYPTQGLAT